MKKTEPGRTLSPFERELSYRLRESPVPPVPEAEIAAAARAAAPWCAPAIGLWDRGLWRAALASLTASAASFWLLCAFLLGAGVTVGLIWSDTVVEPLAALIPLAPVPFLCFLIQELQIRDAALIQLERSCVLDPSRVCLLRLWAGISANGMAVALTGAALKGEALRFCLCAFTALFFLGTAALILLPLGYGPMPLSLLLAAWVLGAFWFLSQRGIPEIIQRIALPLWGGIAGAGLGLFSLASIGASRRLYV